MIFLKLPNYLIDHYQINDVNLLAVPTDYTRVIFNCKGAQLLHVQIYGSTVDLSHLRPCSKVETLVIWNDIEMKPSATADIPISAIEASSFLPQLKSLDVGCCLGEWSRLLETERPLLKDLQLLCTHLDLPAVSLFRWQHVPTLWPNLELFCMGSPGFSSFNCPTLNKLRDCIIPGLTKLTHLHFPWPAVALVPTEEEKKLAKKFKGEMKTLSPHINIQFGYDWCSNAPCIYQQ